MIYIVTCSAVCMYKAEGAKDETPVVMVIWTLAAHELECFACIM